MVSESNEPHEAPPPEPIEAADASTPTKPRPRWKLRDVVIGVALLVALRVAANWAPLLKNAEPQWLIFVLALVVPQLYLILWPTLVVRMRGVKFNFRWPSPLHLLLESGLGVFVAATMYAVVCAGVIGLRRILPDFAPTSPEVVEGFLGGEWYRIVLLLLFASLVAPVCEEIFFRGFLYDALRTRMPLAAAIVLQAVVFGAVHTFGAVHSILVAGVAVVLALVYQFRKTLIAPIIVHSVFNSVQVSLLVLVKLLLSLSPTLGVGVAPHEQGLLVEQVQPDSPAEKAGIREGDVLTELDGRPLKQPLELRLLLAVPRPAGKVKIELLRAGERIEVTVDLKPVSKQPRAAQVEPES